MPIFYSNPLATVRDPLNAGDNSRLSAATVSVTSRLERSRLGVLRRKAAGG